MPDTRKAVVIRSLTSLVFALFAWAGIDGFFRDLAHSTTNGQALQSVFQLGYGSCAILCVYAAWRGSRFARPIHLAWYATCALSAGLATVVWGMASAWMGLLSAAAGLLLAMLLIWPLRRWGIPAESR